MLVPTSQVNAAGGGNKGRDVPAGYSALDGATVSLIKVDDNTVQATDVTDSEGKYEFATVLPNEDYKVEAKKTIGVSEFTVAALVKTNANANQPLVKDLDQNTTVGTVTALTQWNATKDEFPSFFGDVDGLEALYDELVKKFVASGFAAPDLTDPSDVEAAMAKVITEAKPDGQYAGTFAGNKSGRVGVVVKNGNFMVFRMPSETDSILRDIGESVFMGTLAGDGVVSVFGESDLTLTGLLLGGKGTGSWSNSQGTGTWKLSRPQKARSGLYGGYFVHEDPLSGSYVAIYVTDNDKVYIDATAYTDVEFHFSGSGIVATSGNFSYSWIDEMGNTGNGTGKLNPNGTASGIWYDADGNDFTWSASLDFDPFAFFGD